MEAIHNDRSMNIMRDWFCRGQFSNSFVTRHAAVVGW